MGPLKKIKISVRLIKIGIGEAIDLMGEQTPMKIFKATWFYETYLFKLTGRTYNPIFVGLTSQFLQSQLLPLCVCVCMYVLKFVLCHLQFLRIPRRLQKIRTLIHPKLIYGKICFPK